MARKISFAFLLACLVLVKRAFASDSVTNYFYIQDGALLDDYQLLGRRLRGHHFEILETKKFGGSFPIVVSRFEDTLMSKGWGILDIETTSTFHDGVQAFAAGFAEGFATAHQIYSMAKNVASTMFKDVNIELGIDTKGADIEPMPDELVDFLAEQEEWSFQLVQNNIFDEDNKDFDFYVHVGLVMEQFDGLVQGYELKRQILDLPPLPRWVFHMLNAVGDLNDLIPALLGIKLKTYNYFDMTESEAVYYHGLRSSCSALIKVLPGNEDLLFGHNSWFYFTFTNRIFKHYTLNFQNKGTAATGISFSSYPGFLESLDDFYMLSSGISWVQTSNEVLNMTVYSSVTSSSLLAWQRVRVASAMSLKGSDFLKYMKKHYSGTYANQYMVIDLNLFTPGKPLEDNTLWVVEEMPGLILGADKTDILRYGYWPSYNVPYFPQIHERSGYTELEAKFDSNNFSHSLAPRAEIFRKLQNDVEDIEGFKRILRYNDYKNDKYSEMNPSATLCSRYDLLNGKGELRKRPFGCFDAKVTSFKNGAKSRKAQIISGPTSKLTFGAEYLKPFEWSKFDEYVHYGLPKEYKFDFITTQPFYSRWNKEVRTVDV